MNARLPLVLGAVLLASAPTAAQSVVEAPPMSVCAHDLLRTRLATAVGGEQLLAALAVEDELLALCTERQKLVAELVKTNGRLAAQAEEAAAAAATAAAAEDTPDEPMLDQLELASPRQVAEEDSPAENPAPPPVDEDPPPTLVWTAILGTAGDLRAAITDGAGMWWVREGSPLPGDLTVARISARPPGVEVAPGGALPHRSRLAAPAEPGR